MDPSHSETRSLWMDVEMPHAPSLDSDIVADACVIGSGIAGITTAYLLARAGKSVALLDAGEIGSGQTARTTAHLTSALDDRYHLLERVHGPEGAKLAYRSHAAAIELIGEIVSREGIACDFEWVDGYLFEPPGSPGKDLQQEQDAALRAGLQVEFVDRAPIPGFDTGAALRYPRQAQIHPLRYLKGLAHAIVRDGARIYTGTQVKTVQGGSQARVRTASGRMITAGVAIVATNAPINDRLALNARMAPYRTYVVAGKVARGSVPRALYWDTSDPYHYVRLAPVEGHSGQDWLIVGGQDHKTGHDPAAGDRWDRLEAWARERFPVGTFDHRWSGQVMEPSDHLAYVGRDPGNVNVYVATGDSGNGMTHGTLAGILLSDMVLGRGNPWKELYAPSRVRLGSIGDLARENADVVTKLAAWVTPGDVAGIEDIPVDSGAVIRKGLHKVAIYRDPRGAVHVRSAVCSHVGCIVAWNPAETSWDCPCHGSRFDPYGKVLNGPATDDLKEL